MILNLVYFFFPFCSSFLCLVKYFFSRSSFLNADQSLYFSRDSYYFSRADKCIPLKLSIVSDLSFRINKFVKWELSSMNMKKYFSPKKLLTEYSFMSEWTCSNIVVDFGLSEGLFSGARVCLAFRQISHTLFTLIGKWGNNSFRYW